MDNMGTARQHLFLKRPATSPLSKVETASTEYHQSSVSKSRAETTAVVSVGCHSPSRVAMPLRPELEHFADEGEIVRMNRGETQPQLMTMSDMGVKFSVSDLEDSPSSVQQPENKCLVSNRISNT